MGGWRTIYQDGLEVGLQQQQQLARSQLSCKLTWRGIRYFRRESDKRRHKCVTKWSKSASVVQYGVTCVTDRFHC